MGKLITYIHGVRYDLTEFQHIHPGGKLILQFTDNREVSQVFEQYHSMKILNSGIIDKYRMNENDPKYVCKLPTYYIEMKLKVNEYMKNHEFSSNVMNVIQIIRLLFIWVGYIYFYFKSFENLYLLPILIFFNLENGFHIMHDTSHSVFLKNKEQSHMIGYISNDVLNGISYFNWIDNHVFSHHAHCNIDGQDHDIDAYPLRLNKYQPYYWYHKYQHIYVVFLYSTIYVSMYVNDLKSIFTKPKLGGLRYVEFLIYGKLLNFLLFTWMPLYYMNVSLSRFVIKNVLSKMVGGIIISIIFQVSHIFHNSEFNRSDVDWTTNQVISTQDYGVKSYMTSLLTGGLNLQVVHHLFPNISQLYYTSIQPIVQEGLEEKYNKCANFNVAVGSHLKHMYEMSKQKCE
jgi:fatty acid desaturase